MTADVNIIPPTPEEEKPKRPRRTVFTRIRPTVILLHLILGGVVAFCATQFDPGEKTLNIISIYIAGILSTIHNVLKDGDDNNVKVRTNIVILSLISGAVVCYFTWRFHSGMTPIVQALILAHVVAIKDLVRDEDVFEKMGAYGDKDKDEQPGVCRYPGGEEKQS